MANRSSQTLRNVWLSCDRWPDSQSLETWARDIFRIAKANTAEEKAIALYQWTCICLGRSGPPPHEGERGHEAYLMDTLKYLNVYGGHYCDGLSRLMINAWEAAGCGKARKMVICRLGHTVAELQYRDADGKTRWHVFDPEHGWYVYTRDQGHIASIAEIDADPDLLLNPEDPPRPCFYSKARMQRYHTEESTHNAFPSVSPPPQHKMLMNLRPGERWTRRWSPGAQYWPYIFGPEPQPITHLWVEQDARGNPPTPVADTFLGEALESYLYPTPDTAWLLHDNERTDRCRIPGMVELTYQPPLNTAVWKSGTLSAINLMQAKPDSRAARIHARRAGALGQLTYEIQSPYIITDASIEATVRTGGDELDMLAFFISLDDGSSWKRIWGNAFAQEEQADEPPREIKVPFGAEAYHADEFSVVGKYNYQLRIDFLAQHHAPAVGLDHLLIKTACQCGMMALPALQPGSNRINIRVGRASQAAGQLRLDYQWTENGRDKRNFTASFPPSGGQGDIHVNCQSPQELRMNSVSLACEI